MCYRRCLKCSVFLVVAQDQQEYEGNRCQYDGLCQGKDELNGEDDKVQEEAHRSSPEVVDDSQLP